MIDRRRALLSLVSLALGACRRRPPSEAAGEPAPITPGGPWKELSFDPGPDAPEGERALLFAPKLDVAAPLVVALHGRGESGRGLDVGARGWRDDYAIERMHERLRRPPLTPADLLDFTTDARLAALNASLAAHPFAGLRLATPYTPDLSDRSPEGARGFARFVVERLLPRCASESGVPLARASTGIDGVSMGGRLALLVGLERPDVFASVGALQPALRVEEAPLFAGLAKAAMGRAPLALRLVSSEDDPFLPAVRALAAKLGEVGVPHELVVVPGPHDYAFNRGPGGAELLWFHERALRGFL